MPKVYIIILNWNGLKDTLECLESVYRLNYPDYEVIVVDNCSSDDSVKTIRTNFPRVIIIENRENLGFTGGSNAGIRYAMELGADYVWLLNNDTIAEPDSLSKLVDQSERSPEIGLASPGIYFYDNPEEIQFLGAYADFTHFVITPVEEAQELGNELVLRHLILWGTALLIKRKVIETVGYLSEKYFAYVEDCDYSLRALRANFRTTVITDARILHKGTRTAGMYSPFHVFLGTRNLFFFWRNHSRGLNRFSVLCYYIGIVINYAKCLADGGNEKGFDACLNGFWAALKGKGGAYDQSIVIPRVLRGLLCFFVSWHPYFWFRLLRWDIRGIFREALARTQTRFS